MLELLLSSLRGGNLFHIPVDSHAGIAFAADLGAHVRGDGGARRGPRPPARLRVLAAHHRDAQPVAALRATRAYRAHRPLQGHSRLQGRTLGLLPGRLGFYSYPYMLRQHRRLPCVALSIREFYRTYG